MKAKKDKTTDSSAAQKGVRGMKGRSVDYSNQWDILPKDPQEYRACTVYEYSRESPLLQDLIFKQLSGKPLPLSTGIKGFEAIDHLTEISYELSDMVLEAQFRKVQKAWSIPWVQLTPEDRGHLVSSIQRPIRMLSYSQMADLIGPDPSLQILQKVQEKPEKWDFMPAVRPCMRNKDPRILLPLFVDASLTGMQLVDAITKFCKEQIAPGISSIKGRGAKNDYWLSALTHLAGLRILSTRRNEEAKNICSEYPESDWRYHLINVEDAPKHRVSKAQEVYKLLFEDQNTIVAMDSHSSMISHVLYRKNHPKGAPKKVR